ncbi:HTH-type transcriptional regulator MalT [Neomoorella glycerini]|uniref:HTH-type transcriptional regulator MalT n=1 Tax=Neomoorella glycerini TaxID=55779 RepID=A0A6I5ZQG4_9FIRM|nr:BTAD domain-containing putative transcriptional regulator [Moorella glycerini]QGP91869.1 HTH-type transcriptional regulator MalT [Moorella glycerini]
MLKSLALVESKLVAPRPEADIWLRPELKNKLQRLMDYSLTVISAPAGYGKTTAIVQALALLEVPYGWYSPGPEDASSFVFASYLAGALEKLAPGIRDKLPEELKKYEALNWDSVLNVLLHSLEEYTGVEGILIIDDWHLVGEEKEVSLFLDRFLACKPRWLRVALLSREKVEIPEVYRQAARGQRLLIDEKDLALNPEEVYEYLSREFSPRLTREDARWIYDYSEGWIMTLKLIGRGIKEGTVRLPLSNTLDNSLDSLFEFLILDVLERQDSSLLSFLLKTSILDYLSLHACTVVMGGEFTPRLLSRASKKGLFLSELGNGLFRYHNLFRDFLRREARKRLPDYELLHCRAGYFYLKEGQEEQAFQHLLEGRQWADAAEVLARLSSELARSGRGHLLRHYLQQLPPRFQEQVEFLLALGDAERLASNYQGALALYRRAAEKCKNSSDRKGLSRALKGLGETYVDTAQPALAEDFLRRAYKALGEADTEEKAEILGLMAENMINQGKPRHAHRYRQLAKEMLHLTTRGNFEARLLLRTGRLQAAIQLLESSASQEKGSYHPPLSFRETPLLLSLCYSMIGEGEKAVIAAEEGIRLGQKLRSPFVEAMGYVRLGHALLVLKGWPTGACREAYQRALELNDNLGIIRGRTEVMMGQCLIHGLEGDWLAARSSGLEGVRVTEQVRDRWFTAVLYNCLGVAAATCQQLAEARVYLARGHDLFCRCGDSFGKATAAWWLAYLAFKAGPGEELRSRLIQLLELCESRGYDFLLQRGTLLGARDGRASVPLLHEARRQDICQPYVDWQLQKMGVNTEFPCIGYTLRIQTLGKFRVWRGEEEIGCHEWRRESARRLFQLLITKRRVLLHKEEIMAYLWPEADPEAAGRDFKVALNTLLSVLEPERQPRSPSFFIQREGTAYFFNLASGFWLDVEEFEGLVRRAEEVVNERPEQAEILLNRALELYEGEYLQGVNQDEWCLEERERLVVMYIHAAEILARLLAGRGDYQGCIEWADRILKKDNCWEEAYRLKIYSYGKLNNKAMVVRVYQRCLQVLREEMGVAPSLKTVKLYKKILQVSAAM